jgi:hypothetical protein
MRTHIIASALLALALAITTSGCRPASTAVRTTGEAAADTTRAASDAAEAGAKGAANVVEETTEAVGDAIRR